MKMFRLMLILQLYAGFCYAQRDSLHCTYSKTESLGRQFRNARIAYPGDSRIDVVYHHLNLSVSYTSRYISGVVRTDFLTTEDNFNACSFDLHASLKVDSVVMDRKKVAFTRPGNKINLTFPDTYARSRRLSLLIYYQGTPRQSAFGSFSFGTHGGGAPVVWSLSEPYGAPDWWPCKDDPSDKIDSVKVWITMPSGFVSVSNGVLTEQKLNADNTKTYKWASNYPIAHYLISIACSNYTEYTDYFAYTPTDSMKISHFIYPEVFTPNVRTQLDETEKMLRFFSDKFGLYPFIKEKYGHAMCGFNGGMEHQTVSSMGAFNQDLVAHELAHQWFGDKINCKTWTDIWVNEGFASYAEALYAEYKYDVFRYRSYMAEYATGAKKAVGSIAIQNIQDENEIFDYDKTYAKGAMVLHMLRGVLGDKVFFEVLKAYSGSEYAYGAAGIDDFKKVAERVSKKDLKYFFDEWLYGESYPKYRVRWKKNSASSITVKIDQTQLATRPEYFAMPVDLRVQTANNQDTTVTVFMEGASKEFTIDKLKYQPEFVSFDPEAKILRDVVELGLVLGLEEEESLFVVYPNPTEKSLKLRHGYSKVDKIEVLDGLGKMYPAPVLSVDEVDVSLLSPGKYFVRLQSGNHLVSRAFLVR